MERYTTGQAFEVPVWEGQPGFYRADLHLHGVQHRGDSYEGRVFLDNPEAAPATSLEPASGYAGSFYVFGHGPCYGDDGHCAVPEGPIHPFDYRRPHQLNPRLAVVTITEALQRLIEAGGSEFTVTVVPSNVRDEEVGDILHFDRLSLVTYD
jgi:tyrosinase